MRIILRHFYVSDIDFRISMADFAFGKGLSVFASSPKEIKQEAHGLRVAHLSDIATADMQMLCNIFPILSSQLMKRSSFKQFFILKKNIYGMPVN